MRPTPRRARTSQPTTISVSNPRMSASSNKERCPRSIRPPANCYSPRRIRWRCSPDGHGGTVAALERNGCLSDARQRGVQHLAYIQVDNPLANLCDPTLIGHHLMSQQRDDDPSGSQTLSDRESRQRGLRRTVTSRSSNTATCPIRPPRATDADGQLKFWAGSIGVHVIDVAFLQRMSRSDDALPFHRASKKVPSLDRGGSAGRAGRAQRDEIRAVHLRPAASSRTMHSSSNRCPARRLPRSRMPMEPRPTRRRSQGRRFRTCIAAGSSRPARWSTRGFRSRLTPDFRLSPSELAEKIPANLRIDVGPVF